jgi:hypothetical protein
MRLYPRPLNVIVNEAQWDARMRVIAYLSRTKDWDALQLIANMKEEDRAR